MELSSEILHHKHWHDADAEPPIRMTFAERLSHLTTNPNEKFPQYFASGNL